MNTINSNELDLDKIISEYTPYIRTIINNMSNNNLSVEDKEEILADTFFILWKNQKNITVSFDSYISGITRNLVRERFRKKNYTYNLSDYENSIGYYDTENFLDKNFYIDNLRETFNSLKEIDIKIINMFYYFDKPIKDIAKELNLSEINVRSRLHRARKKIKKNFYKGG